MAIDMLSFQGVEVQKAYDTLASAGIQNDIARQIIGIWIGEAAVGSRNFQYSHALADAEAGCKPAPFARSFAHQDWVDGTSIVQAGETPTEKGFNDRFHKIEGDLDRLGALVAQSFACMNDVRATMVVALREIAAELNRINADLGDIRRNLPVHKTPIGPVDKGLQFLGKTKYFDNSVLVFQDADGHLINLPDTTTTSYAAAVEPRAPKAAEIFARDKDIHDAFPGEVSKQQVIAKFHDRISSDGSRLSDLIASLPDGQAFRSIDDMVANLADRDVALLKGMGADARLRNSLGVADNAAVSTAPTNRVEGVSPALGEALTTAGIKTVADLGTLSPAKMVEIAKARNIDVTLSAASALVMRGRVLRGL
jgi:hypothetical protein